MCHISSPRILLSDWPNSSDNEPGDPHREARQSHLFSPGILSSLNVRPRWPHLNNAISDMLGIPFPCMYIQHYILYIKLKGLTGWWSALRADKKVACLGLHAVYTLGANMVPHSQGRHGVPTLRADTVSPLSGPTRCRHSQG